MAGIWADFPSGSHGLYGDSEAAMLNGIWSDVTGVIISNDPDPLIGAAGKVIGGSTSNGGALYPLATPHGTVGIACRVWMPTLPVDDSNRIIIAQWRTAANAVIAQAWITPSGQISFSVGNSETLAANFTTPAPVVTANAWWHIECKLVCGLALNADIEIRVNGVEKMNETGFSTSVATTSIAALRWLAGVGDIAPYYKDVVFWDGSGANVNDFQGTVSIFWQPVAVDIATAGWGFSSGSSAEALIGVVGPPNDANYVSAGDPPPTAMQLELEDLPPDITSIKFIVPVVRAAKVDGGDGNIQLALSPNGTNYDTGPDTPITTAFTYWGNASAPFVSHLNPATSAAWTPGDFATGVRLRINRTL